MLMFGCSGVLMESKHDDGRVERVKVDPGESWDTYDDKPRPNATVKSSNKKLEDMSIILKKESTF